MFIDIKFRGLLVPLVIYILLFYNPKKLLYFPQEGMWKTTTK